MQKTELENFEPLLSYGVESESYKLVCMLRDGRIPLPPNMYPNLYDRNLNLITTITFEQVKVFKICFLHIVKEVKSTD